LPQEGAQRVASVSPSKENPLGFERQEMGGAQVMRFHAAKILSEQTVSEFGNRLLDVIQEVPDPPRLVVSFAGVYFLSSAGVGKLVLIQRKVKERGGELKLCDLAPTTLEVFKVARLQDYFSIYTDVNSALASMP
jgi:anti-sigma B factor antagonist